MKSAIRIISIALAMSICAITLSAQSYRSSYSTNGDSVYYDGRPIHGADAYSFQILGHGYAKDCHYVYLDGRVLEYVDPNGFRVMDRGFGEMEREPDGRGRQQDMRPEGRGDGRGEGGYYKSKWEVFYNGRKIEDASAQSFVELGQGYAKDSFNVYYKGRKIEGAMPSSFVIDRDGYAHDTFETYYFGKKISD